MQLNVSFIFACRQKQTDPGETSWKLAILPGTIVWSDTAAGVMTAGFSPRKVLLLRFITQETGILS